MPTITRCRVRQLRRDAGSDTVSLAILMPVALLLILSVVQAGLAWHTRTVLAEAAQSGVAAGRVHASTASQTQHAALSFIHRAGTGLITRPAADADIETTTIEVTVTGTAPRVLPVPGLDLRLTQGARAPRERFTTPQRDRS
ncbi:pilus assembly protein [Haloechinothrix sp. YIM 98757]|uniref:Pilus assembly protein n=1 Tax=Haloechinothrix aidingensis TaxID=2752311 RepID=A0A838ADN8_9PSEU|nr:TadE family protein [Haloechinothrix aidingensis]MBA0127275.1 pilus assembly protein [Haloechinothrix aidingensis]